MRKKLMGILLGVTMVLTACQGEVKSQDYVSKDGSFTVTFPEGMEQTEYTVTEGAIMMGLEPGDSGINGSVMIQAFDKAGVSTGQNIKDLEDYEEYINDIYLQGQAMTVDWEEEKELEVDGFKDASEKSGIATANGAKSDVYAQYIETDGRYYMVFMSGSKKGMKSMQSVFALKEDKDLATKNSQSATAEDFIYTMTAALDSVNGANMFQMMKLLEEQEQDVSSLEPAARQSLEEYWSIASADDLMDTANRLLNGLHNPVALESLEQYNITSEMSREEVIQLIEENGLDENTKIALLAAYDARVAFGEHAILAWDLSRIPTIMSQGYAAGYCTYEEAMDMSLKAAKTAQKAFDSWDAFNQSYLYGYTYWSEEDLEDSSSSAAQRAAILEDLKADGKFDIDWNIKLEKTW